MNAKGSMSSARIAGDVLARDPFTSSSPRFRGVRRFYRDPKAVIATAILLVFIFVAVTAPVIAPHPVNAQDAYRGLELPSREHPLGTDRLGRDLLTRMMYGTRISVSVGLIAVGIAAGLG